MIALAPGPLVGKAASLLKTALVLVLCCIGVAWVRLHWLGLLAS
jgi:hypothetical protein